MKIITSNNLTTSTNSISFEKNKRTKDASEEYHQGNTKNKKVLIGVGAATAICAVATAAIMIARGKGCKLTERVDDLGHKIVDKLTKNGKLLESKKFYDNGEICSIKKYTNGVISKETEFRENKINAITKYKNGLLSKETEFQENGNHYRISKYTNGIIEKRITYKQDGKTPFAIEDFEKGLPSKTTIYETENNSIRRIVYHEKGIEKEHIDFEECSNMFKTITRFGEKGKTNSWEASDFRDGKPDTIKVFDDKGEILPEISQEMQDEIQKSLEEIYKKLM